MAAPLPTIAYAINGSTFKNNKPAPHAFNKFAAIKTRAFGNVSANIPTQGASKTNAIKNELCNAGIYQFAGFALCITSAITVNKIALSAKADKN